MGGEPRITREPRVTREPHVTRQPRVRQTLLTKQNFWTRITQSASQVRPHLVALSWGEAAPRPPPPPGASPSCSPVPASGLGLRLLSSAAKGSLHGQQRGSARDLPAGDMELPHPVSRAPPRMQSIAANGKKCCYMDTHYVLPFRSE